MRTKPNKTITVKEYISEAKLELDKVVKRAIKRNRRIHIIAPVGTGKTTFAMEIIQEYMDDYQIILLEPQIGISEQIADKLEAKSIPVFVFNSTTETAFNKWEYQNQKLWDDTIISTIDSGWKFLESSRTGVGSKPKIVIIDETHAFLQHARVGFDKTAQAILDCECPIIGFTATRSNWVLNYVIDIERLIVVNATDIPVKKIKPFKIKSMIQTIAQVVKNKNYKKVVIFTNNIGDQTKIKNAIKEATPKKKVVVLNADTKKKEELKAWDNLIKKEKLPPRTNVMIINEVAQAGININDTDIDLVMLVGKIDPLGFLQYLGRCRNYTKDFHFVYRDFGIKSTSWTNPENLEKSLKSIETEIKGYKTSNIKTLRNIDPSAKELYVKLPGDDRTGYRLNRCLAAYTVYSEFRNLHGDKLIEFLINISADVEFDEQHEYTGITLVDNSTSKTQQRKKHKDALAELVIENCRYLVGLYPFINEGWKHDDAYEAIGDSTDDKNRAESEGLLYLPKSKKTSLRKVIKTSQKANESSLVRVILAANYALNRKKDKKTKSTVGRIMKMSIGDARKHIGAKGFFEKDYANEKLLKTALNSIKREIDSSNTLTEWLDLIKAYLGTMYGIERLARPLYDYCMIVKRVKVKGVNKYKLEKVVDNYPDYRKAHKLDKVLD
jgi:hypothetical protein